MSDQEKYCFHCQDELPRDPVIYDNKSFCCQSCQQVYRLLSNHELGQYYQQDSKAGIRPNRYASSNFEMLDVPEIRQKYVDFEEGSKLSITLHLPQIHCASCIYLLEHLNKLNEGIILSRVHFPKRLAIITIDLNQIKLSELAILLTRIGYEPNFSHVDKKSSTFDKRLLLQLGLAGFAFGSIMLWSFPEYLGIDESYQGFRQLSSYLSLLVSIPVLFFSAQDYFKSAWGAIRVKYLNLDVPIVIGIIALYLRSVYAIINNEGPGYMDSFAAFIFFLLIGKWFQGKTYQWLSFDRDYKSYFPVAVLKLVNEQTQLCLIENLAVDDVILIRNEEIIPCDSVLLSEKAIIDYSFVTGEADWLEKNKNAAIFAGGKICGETAQLKVSKTTTRSALTQIWNKGDQDEQELAFQTRQDRVSRYFIAAVILIAFIAAIVWSFIDISAIPEVITSVLIVACPCALALSVPFTYGNMMRKLGRKGFFLRNTTIIEKMQQCDTIIFDKTGTLTEQNFKQISYEGRALTDRELQLLMAMTQHATHPYAIAIFDYLTAEHTVDSTLNFKLPIEIPGQGIELENYKLGSASYTNTMSTQIQENSSVFADEKGFIGRFIFKSSVRNGMENLIKNLSANYKFAVISGDKPLDLHQLQGFFPSDTTFLFEQKPIDKKLYVEKMQKEGHRILMVGDGLNDSGALNAAFVGIALTENLIRFTPASDAILKAENLRYLDDYLSYVNKGKSYLKRTFAFSITYNLIGIGVAVMGLLTPFVATILMPLSSITVVGLATFMTLSRKLKPSRDL